MTIIADRSIFNIIWKKELVVLINSIIFTAVFNSSVLIQRYNNYKIAGENKAFYLLLFEIFMAVMLIYPLIYALSGRRLIWRILLSFIYIISGLAAYFIYSFNITLTNEIVASFFESSKAEILNFLNLKLIAVLILSSLLGVLSSFFMSFSKIDAEKNKKLTFITAVFTLACILGDGDWANNIMPYNIIKHSSGYILEKSSMVKKRLNLATEFHHQLLDNDNDLNVILIIGESARGDHFSLSGYAKETSPLMAKEKNLIYFNDVTACFPLTRSAVPCMLTRATRENRKVSLTETSFIGIFKQLGFYTTWLGMQGTYTVIDAPYMDLANESNKSLLIGVDVDVFSTIDEKLLPFVDQFFQEHSSGNNLLVLHTYGSHFHYEERYTEEFRKFTPTCFKKKFLADMSHCSNDEIINSYDNSILYTDHFIKTVIDRVRDKNALVIFTPDHGESLGEEGRYLHGTHNADEQIAVNMMVWVSDKYKQKYPQFVSNLEQKQKDSILHDHLFHSILGCSGIKSDAMDNNLNLCRER